MKDLRKNKHYIEWGGLILVTLALAGYFIYIWTTPLETKFTITKEICEEKIIEETHILEPMSSNDFGWSNISFKIEDYKLNNEKIHSSICYSTQPNVSEGEGYFLEGTTIIDETIYCLFNIISLEDQKILKEDGWWQEIKKYDTIRRVTVLLNLNNELKGDKRLLFDFNKVYIKNLGYDENRVINNNPYFDVLITIFKNQTTCSQIALEERELLYYNEGGIGQTRITIEWLDENAKCILGYYGDDAVCIIGITEGDECKNYDSCEKYKLGNYTITVK